MVIINKKLLPAAVLVRKERQMLNGQARPNPTIIKASKILIFFSLRRVERYGAAPAYTYILAFLFLAVQRHKKPGLGPGVCKITAVL